MLNGYVPGIKRWESHSERASACVYAVWQWYPTVGRHGWKNGGRWSLTQVEDRPEIFLIELLEGKHRRILSYRVPKDRTEDANVKAPAVASADNRLVCPLISHAQARSKCFIAGLDVELLIDLPHSTYEEFTCIEV